MRHYQRVAGISADPLPERDGGDGVSVGQSGDVDALVHLPAAGGLHDDAALFLVGAQLGCGRICLFVLYSCISGSYGVDY